MHLNRQRQRRLGVDLEVFLPELCQPQACAALPAGGGALHAERRFKTVVGQTVYFAVRSGSGVTITDERGLAARRHCHARQQAARARSAARAALPALASATGNAGRPVVMGRGTSRAV